MEDPRSVVAWTGRSLPGPTVKASAHRKIRKRTVVRKTALISRVLLLVHGSRDRSVVIAGTPSMNGMHLHQVMKRPTWSVVTTVEHGKQRRDVQIGGDVPETPVRGNGKIR